MLALHPPVIIQCSLNAQFMIIVIGFKRIIVIVTGMMLLWDLEIINLVLAILKLLKWLSSYLQQQNILEHNSHEHTLL